MITGIDMTGSSIYYQRQLADAKDITPLLSSTEPFSQSSNTDYRVDMGREEDKIKQEYSGKQTTLKKEHETDIRQLEVQYNRKQNQIEQEYTIKKRALTNINIYA